MLYLLGGIGEITLGIGAAMAVTELLGWPIPRTHPSGSYHES
jgi:hypothetical protein